MRKDSLELIIRGLNDAGVKYLIVGGLAVNAHGYVRFTADVDMILAMDDANVRSALAVLKLLNYRPRAPVSIEEFAILAKRREWMEQKRLKAFSLFSSDHPQTEVDLFIEDPLGMDQALAQSVPFPLAEGINAPVCSVRDLLKLKQAADRPKDRIDIEKLKALYPEL